MEPHPRCYDDLHLACRECHRRAQCPKWHGLCACDQRDPDSHGIGDGFSSRFGHGHPHPHHSACCWMRSSGGPVRGR